MSGDADTTVFWHNSNTFRNISRHSARADRCACQRRVDYWPWQTPALFECTFSWVNWFWIMDGCQNVGDLTHKLTNKHTTGLWCMDNMFSKWPRFREEGCVCQGSGTCRAKFKTSRGRLGIHDLNLTLIKCCLTLTVFNHGSSSITTIFFCPHLRCSCLDIAKKISF